LTRNAHAVVVVFLGFCTSLIGSLVFSPPSTRFKLVLLYTLVVATVATVVAQLALLVVVVAVAS